MLNSTDEKFQELLRQLSGMAGKIIIHNLKSGSLQPERHYEDFTTIDDFRYEITGAVYNNSTNHQRQVTSWHRACFQVAQVLRQSNEYSLAKAYISQHYAHPNAVHWFDQYVFRSFSFFFDHPNHPNQSAIELQILNFIRDIKDEPHLAKASVYLVGLALESPQIIIAPDIVLRQTVKSDLEGVKKPINNFAYGATPSAVLEIQMNLKREETRLLQESVERYVNLLRLFDVGSVNYTFYEMQFDAIVTPSGQMSAPHNIDFPWKHYRISQAHEASFLKYMRQFILPKSLYNFEKQPDFLTTAFDRYKEAILERAPVERRIANTIMGIEAILSNDNQELSFKMQIRAAKVLSMFGLDPLTVRKHMGKAYGIRSKYAHGGFLDQKNMRDLEKIVGDVQDFCWSMVGYLRILIVVSITIELSKDKFLALVDDALIDELSWQKLQQCIQPVKLLSVPDVTDEKGIKTNLPQ